jgi:hypothetical protein
MSFSDDRREEVNIIKQTLCRGAVGRGRGARAAVGVFFGTGRIMSEEINEFVLSKACCVTVRTVNTVNK